MKYPYIDLHCDTLMHTWKEEEGRDIVKNDFCHLDFERLKASNAMAQFFAIFMISERMFANLGRPALSDEAYIESMIAQLHRGIEKVDYVKMAYNAEDLEKNYADGAVSAFLTLEDGRAVNGDLDNLEKFYNMGIRLISLTWNYENCIGYPNSTKHDIMSKGLKPFGFEVVDKMNDLGMIIDVSHLSDGGFYDVAKRSKKPFVASHSNARSLSPHPRNLTDDMITFMAERGGIMGLNLMPQFLNEDATRTVGTVARMVDHLNYIKNLAGSDVVALGSDFDGISGQLEIDSCDKFYLLFEALEKDGWTDEELEKLAYKNALRVIKEVM